MALSLALLFLLISGVGALVMYVERKRGAAEERESRAHADAEALRRETEILMEDRTDEDTARNLDAGKF